MDDHFRNLRLVFDTTFCGDWAGNTWNQTSCGQLAPTCEEYVSNTPEAFTEAYWAVNTLQVFQDDGTGPGGSPVPVPATNKTGTGPNVDAGTFKAKAAAQGQGVNTGTGSFIQNAALVHPAIADNQVDVDVSGSMRQSPPGWAPRERRGGSVMSKWR